MSIDKEEKANEIFDLGEKMIKLIDQEKKSNMVVLSTLLMLMETFSKTIKIPKKNFMTLLQLALNNYGED